MALKKYLLAPTVLFTLLRLEILEPPCPLYKVRRPEHLDGKLMNLLLLGRHLFDIFLRYWSGLMYRLHDY